MASSTLSDAREGHSRISPDLQDVVQGVHQKFDTSLDPRSVDECLIRVGATFDDAKVRAFVPLLVRRYVTEELSEKVTEKQSA